MSTLKKIFRSDEILNDGDSEILGYKPRKKPMDTPNGKTTNTNGTGSVIFSTVVHVFHMENETFKQVSESPCGLAVLNRGIADWDTIIIYDSNKIRVCDFYLTDTLVFGMIGELYLQIGSEWCFQLTSQMIANDILALFTICKATYMERSNLNDKVCITKLDSSSKGDEETATIQDIVLLKYSIWELSDFKMPLSLPLSSHEPYIQNHTYTEYALDTGFDVPFPKQIETAIVSIHDTTSMLVSYYNEYMKAWLVAELHVQLLESSIAERVVKIEEFIDESTDAVVFWSKMESSEENVAPAELSSEGSDSKWDTINSKLDILLEAAQSSKNIPSKSFHGVNVVEAVTRLVEENAEKDRRIEKLEEELAQLRAQENPENDELTPKERHELLEKCAEASRLQLKTQEKLLKSLEECGALRDQQQLYNQLKDKIHTILVETYDSFVAELNLEETYQGDRVKNMTKSLLKTLAKELLSE